MGRKRIVVLAGGWSGEREVSLQSGRAVFGALDRQRYDVSLKDPRDDLGELIKGKEDIDLVFVLLHGRFGEDGRIQGILDILGIDYVGSGVLSSAMALNKRVAKACYRQAGLRVADDVVLKRGKPFSVEGITERLGTQTVVKPVSEGSSLGVSVCTGSKELAAGIDAAFQHDAEVLVERFVEGREITCCVMGKETLETLPLIEIVPADRYRFFDYEAKYTPGATQEICPAQVSQQVEETARSYAKRAHEALCCEGWSRSDMIFQDDKPYLLETNTIPGMTENSLFPLAAKGAGLTFSELLDKLISLSL
jgi:D-alanine-D-alanine ligase